MCASKRWGRPGVCVGQAVTPRCDGVSKLRPRNGQFPSADQRGLVPVAAGEVVQMQMSRGRAAPDVISEYNRREMIADAQFIRGRLKQQYLPADEERELVARVRAWAMWDESASRSGVSGTPFLDRFLGILKQTSVSRSTARTLFGLAGTEELSAYDGLFYELEDDRLAEFRSLISRSHEGTAGRQTSPGPERLRLRREARGDWRVGNNEAGEPDCGVACRRCRVG